METAAKQQEAAVQKSGKRKWLSRVGTFLMMGGWLLIVGLGLGIAIAISILTSGK